MRCLVTGATGFIGSRLAKLLKADGRVTELVLAGRSCCDLTYELDAQKLVHKVRPQVIFHLAGNPSIRDCTPEVTRLNMLATHFLLMHAPHDCRFVFASSAAVYGDNNSWGGVGPTSVYGAAKLGAEGLVNTFTRLGLVKGYNLRLIANVGGGATHGVLKDLLEKLRGPKADLVCLGGYPGSTKPYMWVEDTARTFAELGLSEKYEPGTYDVATTGPVAVQRITELLMEETGITKPVVWDEAGNWPTDNRKVTVVPTYGLPEKSYRTSEGALRAAIKEMLTCE